ncbi:MAG: hypothetical protein K5649_01320 [Lachnospiraceae bacterium]|nr:hypothetical protein [Lachnospiraceae bacterium]
MKTIQKILFGALLIGIGCLASTKVVKADPTVTLTYDNSGTPPTLSYTTSGIDGDEGYTLVLSVGGTAIGDPIALNSANPGDTAWSGASTIITNLGNPTSTGAVTVTATIKEGETVKATGTKDIDVYVFNPTIPSELQITAPDPGTFPIRSLTDDTYNLTVEAISEPNYIATVKIGTGAETSVNKISNIWNGCKASDGTYVFTAGTQTAAINSITDNGAGNKKASITWTPMAGTNPYNYIYYTVTNVTRRAGITSATATVAGYPATDVPITYTGAGTATFSVYISKTELTLPADPEAIAPYIASHAHFLTSSPFTFETIDHIKITPADKTQIVRNVAEHYDATVYLDAAEQVPAANQNVKWTATPTATTEVIPNNTATTAGASLKSTANGSVSLVATSEDGTKSVTKTITVSDRINVETLTVGHGVTKGYKIDLGYNKGLVTVTPANASVSKIEWTVTSGSDYGSIDSDTKTILTGKKKGKVVLTANVYYTDGGAPVPFTNREITVYDPVLKTNDSSDTIKFTLPSAAYTSNSASDNISSVTGYRVDVLNKDGDSVYHDSYTVDSLEGITLSSDKMNDLVRAASDNLTGDTHKVRFQISPYNGSTYNDKYDSSDVRVAYRTDEKTAYKGSDGKYSLSNNNSSSSKGSSTQASASGAGSGNAGSKNGLDKVPKTGEGNTRMLIIMIAMISATIAGAILLSYMPARANTNKGIGGAEDVKGFFDSVSTTSTKDTKTEQTTADNADKDDKQS